MVLTEQISALIDFLENHRDLALGYCSRTNEGRSLSKRCWMECAQILNSVSVDCPNKTPAEWRTFYNEYKSKTLKKVKVMRKNEISATGGGPAKKVLLTPLQERLYNILGHDVGEPLPGVHSLMLDYYEEPVTIPKVELVENEEISLDKESLEVRPSTTDQPPKRRRRLRSVRRYAAEDRPHAALKAVQSRLEAIEARHTEAISKQAEATLKQAEATNNLAAAIAQLSSTTEKMVGLIGQFVTSLPKKPAKCESDSHTKGYVP